MVFSLGNEVSLSREVFFGKSKGAGPITNKAYYFRDEHKVFPTQRGARS